MTWTDVRKVSITVTALQLQLSVTEQKRQGKTRKSGKTTHDKVICRLRISTGNISHTTVGGGLKIRDTKTQVQK